MNQAPQHTFWKETRFFLLALAGATGVIYLLSLILKKEVTLQPFIQTAIVVVLCIYIVRVIFLIMRRIK